MKSHLLRSLLSLIFLVAALFTSQQANAQCASSSNIYTFKYNKHTYEVVKENRTWAIASKCAVSRGGYLVHINSKTEQDVLYAQLSGKAKITKSKTESQFGYGTVWLGGTDSLTEGKWIWDGDNNGTGPQWWSGGLTGSAVGGRYNKWGDEPDNSGNQDAASMTLETTPRNKFSEWNDLDGNKNWIYYVIEYNCATTNRSIDTTVCDSYVSPSGKKWTVSKTYRDTIPSKFGCDSIFKITLTIDAAKVTVDTTACGTFISPNGTKRTASGMYIDTVKSSHNCDSIITTNLILNQVSTNTISPSACGSYTSPGGKIWTTSGTYTDTLTNAKGCDSISTINLTVNTSTSSSLSVNVCNSYTSPSGKVWMTVGTYIDTIANNKGCDSIITINLSLLNSRGSIKTEVCGKYVSPSGKSLFISGVFFDTIPNAAGCDSVILLDLKVKQPSYKNIKPIGCRSYTSPSGKVLTQSGRYADTIANAVGCDSIISIDLRVISIDTNVVQSVNTLTALAGASDFQWLDCDADYATINGATGNAIIINRDAVYAVEITQETCIDTSRCVSISYVGLPDFSSENGIKLYPNPTNGAITLQFESNPGNIEVSVSNLTGRILLRKAFDGGDAMNFDLPSEQGYYLVKVVSNKYQSTIKVLKTE